MQFLINNMQSLCPITKYNVLNIDDQYIFLIGHISSSPLKHFVKSLGDIK